MIVSATGLKNEKGYKMVQLKTNYLGLELNNPIIVGSSGLTKSIEKIERCEEAGAGAIVLKSLFEEVLAREDLELDKSVSMHPEVYDYIRSEIQMQYGPKEYCELVSQVKQKVKIPVIGSINCISNKWWPNFARQLEEAGVDAIELNIFSLANKTSVNSDALEEHYFNILETIKSKIKIPVAMKISNYFTSLAHFAKELEKKGLDGLVIFNRFTEPDIDLDKLELKHTFSFTGRDQIFTVLRWVGILSGQIACDISATTGIHSAEDVIKLLLAGAKTVQLVSVLYQKGIKEIEQILKEIKEWMRQHHFNSIDQMRGKLSFSQENLAEVYLHTQFMEKIKGIE
jgi:dihydroorotate dehydrogenase (fumarate)